MRISTDNRSYQPEDRTSSEKSGMPRSQTPSKQDLDALDAEARVDYKRWTPPRTIFIGFRQSPSAVTRSPTLVETSTDTIKSIFRRMLESLFGSSALRQ